jgi:toxin YoeB
VNIQFTPEAWEDYLYWQGMDKRTLKRINELLKDASRTPFDGRGKPEPLRHELRGCWSRRIDQEHRLVYEVEGDILRVISVRFHY